MAVLRRMPYEQCVSFDFCWVLRYEKSRGPKSLPNNSHCSIVAIPFRSSLGRTDSSLIYNCTKRHENNSPLEEGKKS